MKAQTVLELTPASVHENSSLHVFCASVNRVYVLQGSFMQYLLSEQPLRLQLALCSSLRLDANVIFMLSNMATRSCSSLLCSGRWMAKKLAEAGQEWSRRAAAAMPSASGDIREIVDQPVFVPLYSLFRVYGPIFKLSFGPQTFVVISDPDMAKQVRPFVLPCAHIQANECLY
jgi:hypothetical protein